MSELWSSQQHAWLTALGHTLYVPGSAEPPEAVAGPRASAEPTRAPPAAAPVARPAVRARQAPAAEPAPTASPVPPASRRRPSQLPDKLHFALIRASGCNPNTEEAAAIIAEWPPAAELRGNPAAKRALWPRLRALRRGPA